VGFKDHASPAVSARSALAHGTMSSQLSQLLDSAHDHHLELAVSSGPVKPGLMLKQSAPHQLVKPAASSGRRATAARRKGKQPKKIKKVTDPFVVQYNRAKELGWIPLFQSAGKDNDFPAEVLMAIGSRETNLDPKYLKVGGDVHDGTPHGYGLMQADVRSFPEWINSGKWHDAGEGIKKGAEVLASKRDQVKSWEGKKKLKVKSLSGKATEFDGIMIEPDKLLKIVIASYNCGMWAYYHYSMGHDIDRGTTPGPYSKNHKGDYSKDVLERAARFALMIKADAEAPPPKPGDEQNTPPTH
jgi:hypothetical protein